MNPAIPTEQARQRAFQQTLLSARRTMVYSETLKLALDSFRASKTRFALTALGMVIGTASVILVITIGMTGKQFILEELQKIETNSVELEYSGGGATAQERVLYSDSLTDEDRKAVVAQLPGVVSSSPVVEMHDRISFGGGVTKDTLVLGVSPQYQQIRNLLVPNGRFIDDEDTSAHTECAVVSEEFAHDRFGGDDQAIGQTFEIIGIPFTIIGVFKEAVSDFGNSEIQDQTILIPYSVARYFTGTENVNQIYFSMRNMNEVPDAAKEIVGIMHQGGRHRPDSVYKAQTLTEYLTVANTIANYLTLLLVAVAAVTLAVGGVGIMNIMLAGVRARVREIGIRKALGATQRDLMLQVLSESVLMSVSGGALGVLLGAALTLILGKVFSLTLRITVPYVAISIFVSSAVGIISGWYPASRAAKLDPIAALRSE